MRVILSARAAWAVTNDANVVENVHTASMKTRKSRMNIDIYRVGDVVVLGPTTSTRVMVLEDEGS